jgi:anti-sigma factor RsiW
MNCQQARHLADRFFRGELNSREERNLDRHVAGCSECRTWFGAADPIRMFRNLESPARDGQFWADFWPRVRADIEAPSVPATWWSLGWRPAAAIATGVLSVAILIGVWNLVRDGSTPAEVPLAGRPASGPESSPMVRRTSAPPTVESYPSADSRVFSFRLEEASGPPTEVILIFDESIDL